MPFCSTYSRPRKNTNNSELEGRKRLVNDVSQIQSCSVCSWKTVAIGDLWVVARALLDGCQGIFGGCQGVAISLLGCSGW